VAQGGPYDDSVSYQKTNAHNSQRYIFLFEKITFYTSSNYELTSWSTVLPEKLTVLQLIKKFPAFYET
jgi:hypothetical protein